MTFHQRTIAGLAAALLGLGALAGAATAGAAPADDQFLQTVENLGIEFTSDAAAINAGHDVCATFAADQAAGVDPAETRAAIVGSFTKAGLDGSQAANLMWASVDTYCPELNEAAGD